jgi:16S rRNA processing protein RimM
MTDATDRRVTVGRVVGLFGVRGWVKVYSHTRPREAILNYKPWLVELAGAWRDFEVIEGRVQGKGVIAHIKGYDDRDSAMALIGTDIAVALAQLPPTNENEFYWAQLEGLRVVTLDGQVLGNVSHLFETGGANDVMVIKGERERLIPFSKSTIQRVDLVAGLIEVNWDAAD